MTGVRREEDWEGRNHRHHQPFPLRRGKVVCSSIRCALRPLTIPARARTHRRVNSVIQALRPGMTRFFAKNA